MVLVAGVVAGLTGCGLGGHAAGVAERSGGAASSAGAGASGGGTTSSGTTSGTAGPSGASSSTAATDVGALQQAVDQAGTLADQVHQDIAGDSDS